MSEPASLHPEWDDEVIPLLRWVKAQEEEEGGPIFVLSSAYDAITTELGVPRDRVSTRFGSLIANEWLFGEEHASMGTRDREYTRVRSTTRGLQLIGVWPSREITPETLKAVFEEAIWATKSEDERNRLERLRDAALDLGRDTFISVMTALAKQAAGQALG